MFDASASTSDREVLTGKAAGDQVDVGERVRVDGRDVGVAPRMGPVSLQDLACRVVELDLVDGLGADACDLESVLEAQLQAADAGEQCA